MKIYPDTKVYVMCPGNNSSGGPESLHQLCSQLINHNINAFMYYISNDPKLFNPINPVHKNFEKYHLPYTLEIEDDEKNVIVISEAFSQYLYFTEKIQRVFWWLSVNIYIKKLRDLIYKHFLNPLVEPMPKVFYFYRENENIEQWGQSEYVRQFLYLNGVKDSKNIETPMSHNFVSQAPHIDFSKKENIVVFNPRKDTEIAEKIIAKAPNIDWRRIQDMTPEEVQALLAKAKVYMDFGYFPGRERLPREATLSGCVVITGKRGAAANDIDINIPAEFKFDTNNLVPQQVIEKIQEIFNHFEENYNAQKAFHDKELNAPKVFKAKVVEYFDIKELPLPRVAFVQGVGTESFMLAKIFSKDKDFSPSFIIDDDLALMKKNDERILREHNRSYIHIDDNLIEVITRADARFLYLEGRINKFALLEPSDDELAELKDFYEADDADILVFGL